MVRCDDDIGARIAAPKSEGLLPAGMTRHRLLDHIAVEIDPPLLGSGTVCRTGSGDTMVDLEARVASPKSRSEVADGDA
ncbi:hypothetical protein E2562_009701 [Oryza meyeriana var. granulata]|uniref:Uncharacterized protein n=1 Tax=Oryza meyeriana var. granulata TaxID=110450 RepID=A0A6G1D1P4_9ORYZ|nr:hypothetical protein E2562_009701 [Oryza meyeriana var. granulata]